MNRHWWGKSVLSLKREYWFCIAKYITYCLRISVIKYNILIGISIYRCYKFLIRSMNEVLIYWECILSLNRIRIKNLFNLVYSSVSWMNAIHSAKCWGRLPNLLKKFFFLQLATGFKAMSSLSHSYL